MQHRRRIILIDKKFQFRFAFYIVSWLFALSLIYPLLISNLFDFFMKYASMDPNGPTVSALTRTRQELLTVLILLQVVFVLVTLLISIFLSHRVAGPVYKLKMFLTKAKEGQLRDRLQFRKADHFMEVADLYNEMTAGLLGLIEKDRERIAQAIQALERTSAQVPADGKKAFEEALNQLRSAREHLPH